MELGIDGSALDACEREPPSAAAINATEVIAQRHALSELFLADDRVLCQESARLGEQPEAAATATVDGPRCRLISDLPADVSRMSDPCPFEREPARKESP